MLRVALFDLDRTLVVQDTAGLFIRYEYEMGHVSKARVTQVAWWRSLYSLGVLDEARVAERVLGWYRGRSHGQLRNETQRFAEQRVIPLISDAARQAVQSHQERHDVCVVVTASTRYVTEPVARELEIEHVLCTELELEEEVLTGKLVGSLCYGVGKLARVSAFLSQHGLNWDQTVLYTDSITDLPLLEVVGEPIAVNPDVRLARIARGRGWPILRWA